LTKDPFKITIKKEKSKTEVVMKFKFLERSWMFSLLFLLMIANTVFSQSSDDSVDDIENKKLKDSKNYIGLAVGTSTASGICYRYMDNWGIQFTIIPPIINDDYEFVDGGITLLKEFFSARWIRLFIYTAVSAVYEHTYTYDYSLEEEIKYELKRLLLNWGIGPGLSFTGNILVLI